MSLKKLLFILVVILVVGTALTWENPDWQLEIPALYFFALIFGLTLLDVDLADGYCRSRSPGYLSNIDDSHSHTSINHKDMIDYIDPYFSTAKHPTARFTACVLGGLDWGIVSVRGREAVQIFPSVYLRKKTDGYANDGEFEKWLYNELTPAMKENLNKFTKIRYAVKNNRVPIWVSTVSNLDGSNIKSNLDHNEAIRQANSERSAMEDDRSRALDYVRGKRVLTRYGKRDKVPYEEKE